MTPTLLTPRFAIVSIAHALLAMTFWMFPLFPLYLREAGASDLAIGVFFAIEPLAAIAVRPLVGGLLSRFGHRGVLRAAGAVHAISLGAYLLVDPIGPGMIAVRLVHGASLGTLFASFFAYAAEISPAGRRTEGIALFGVFGMIPGALAPLLAEAVLDTWGYPAFFRTAAILGIVSLLASLPLSEPGGDPESAVGSFWSLVPNPELRRVWAAGLAFSIAMASYLTFLAPYVVSVGSGRAGTFFFAYSVAAVGLRLFAGKVPDRLGPARTVLPSLASLALGLCLLPLWGLVPASGLLVLAGGLCGIGHGYLFPVLTGLAVDGAGPGNRAHAVSLFTALIDAGHMIGPITFGAIATGAGYPAVFLVAAAVVATTSLAWKSDFVGSESRRVERPCEAG